jgi:hypothetical protein
MTDFKHNVAVRFAARGRCYACNRDLTRYCRPLHLTYQKPEASLGDCFLSASRYDASNGRKREKEVKVEGRGGKGGERMVEGVA